MIHLLRSKYSKEDPSSRMVNVNNDPMIEVDYSSGGTGVDVGSFVTHQYQVRWIVSSSELFTVLVYKLIPVWHECQLKYHWPTSRLRS
ncbi:hypothetical protein ACS0PU_010168 [Formica fusca]